MHNNWSKSHSQIMKKQERSRSGCIVSMISGKNPAHYKCFVSSKRRLHLVISSNSIRESRILMLVGFEAALRTPQFSTLLPV